MTPQQIFEQFKIEHDDISVHLVDTINHIDDNIYTRLEDKSLLVYGSYWGDIDLVEKCIKLGADVNKRGGDSPPLCWAFVLNHFDVCKMLLESGADPNVMIYSMNHNCYLPLIFNRRSFRKPKYDYISLLIKHGALLNEFYKYSLEQEVHDDIIKVLAKRRWVTIKCVVLILALHKRAVERVNHPVRLFQQGYFELKE